MTPIIKKMEAPLVLIRKLIKEDLARSYSQADIANKVGISQSAIFKYLETETTPSLDTIKKFSAAYHVPLNKFIHGENALPGGPVPPPLPGDIPVVAFVKGGDKGFFDEQGYPVGEGFKKTKRPYDVKDPRAYGVEVRGTSMAPKFEERETLIVSPAAPVVNGDFVVARTTSDESMVKRIYFRDGLIVLESFNEPPLIYKKEEVLFYHKVVWVKQRG